MELAEDITAACAEIVARTKSWPAGPMSIAEVPTACWKSASMLGNEAALKNYRDMPRSVPQPDVVGRPPGPNRTENSWSMT